MNEKNERHGFGTYAVINAGTYEGYWKNGFKHGDGKFYNKGGVLQYEGEWECGEPHGYGKVYNQWGDLKYEGTMEKGKTKTAKKKYWSDFKNIR